MSRPDEAGVMAGLRVDRDHPRAKDEATRANRRRLVMPVVLPEVELRNRRRYHLAHASSVYPVVLRIAVFHLGPRCSAAFPIGLLAQESVHVGGGKGGVDIAERAVFPHLLCRA